MGSLLNRKSSTSQQQLRHCHRGFLIPEYRGKSHVGTRRAPSAPPCGDNALLSGTQCHQLEIAEIQRVGANERELPPLRSEPDTRRI